MTERRVLPPRANRGKRPQQSQEQKAQDDALYNRLFQKAKNQSVEAAQKAQNTQIQQKAATQELQLFYKQMSSTNRHIFPYSRGYHYFFDLISFPRLEGSVTYAIDSENVFQHTYSQDARVIRQNITIGQLINRQIFGLPFTSVNANSVKTKDKNICHGYLFQNEDRKYYLDKSIYELKSILKNFDRLQSSGNIKNYCCLQKDADLIQVLEEGLTVEQKKDILRKKIRILSEKKESMRTFMLAEDKNFFYNSLNQKLHNQIDNKTHELTLGYIFNQIQYGDSLRINLSTVPSQQHIVALSLLFKYYQTQQSCLGPHCIQKLGKLINQKFFQKSQEGQQVFFQISVPFMFLSFENQQIMCVAEKVLALRLAYQSQATFFMCKTFWKRIFGRELSLNKQIKHLSRQQYDKLVITTLNQFQRWKKHESKKNQPEEKLFQTQMDTLVKYQVFDQNKKQFDLFPLQRGLDLNIRQYIFLVLYYHLYLCIAEVYQFILQNQALNDLISSQHFTKASNYFIQSTGSVRMGILDELLKKMSEWLIRADIQQTFRIKWVYNQQFKVAYLTKLPLQSDWETQKEQDQQQQVDSISDSIQKKVK